MRHLSFIILILFIPFILYSQWTKLNSPTEERLFALDFINPNIGWVAGAENRIFGCEDGGINWNLFSDYTYPEYETWLDIFMIDEKTVYSCGNRFNYNRYQANWTFTPNAGESWISQNIWFTDRSQWSGLEFISEKTGWRVGIYNGHPRIQKTTDGLEKGNWISKDFPIEDGALNSVDFIDENTGWTVGNSGIICRSVDGGETWLQLESNTDKYLRDVYFLDKNIGWIVGHRDEEAIILRTEDGGDHWDSVLPATLSRLNGVYGNDDGEVWACGSILVSETNVGVIIYSDDYGVHWTSQHIEYSCSELYDLDFIGGVAYACGSNGTLLKMIYGDDYLQFSDKKDMLRKKCSFGYATDGEFLYASGGQKPSPFNDYFISDVIQRYNPDFDNWIDWVDGLIPRNFGSAVYLPGSKKLCIVNGESYSPNYYSDTLELVDVVTKSITYKSGNPYPVKKGGVAVWKDKIYLFGGSNEDGFSKRFYEYDPLNDSWERLEDMPERKETVGCIVDDVLYVIGGSNYFSSKKIHAYDLVNKSWTHVADLPKGLKGHSLAKSGKYIWVLGSEEAPTFTGLFNTETYEFEEKYSNLKARKHAGAAVLDDHLYIFGGRISDEYEGIINGVQELDVHNFSGVGIKSVLKTNYAIYPEPNPFISTIHFPLNNLPPGQKELLIYDTFGRIVKSLSTKGMNFIWKADSIDPGTYYYQLFVNEKYCTSGKVMKLK